MTAEQNDMQKLWQNYLFLSKELLKFVSADDLDLFSDLLAQREELFTRIRACEDKNRYVFSQAGQELIGQVVAIDIDLRKKMLMARNMLKNNFTLSSAYDGFIGDSAAVGNRFDSKNQ